VAHMVLNSSGVNAFNTYPYMVSHSMLPEECWHRVPKRDRLKSERKDFGDSPTGLSHLANRLLTGGVAMSMVSRCIQWNGMGMVRELRGTSTTFEDAGWMMNTAKTTAYRRAALRNIPSAARPTTTVFMDAGMKSKPRKMGGLPSNSAKRVPVNTTMNPNSGPRRSPYTGGKTSDSGKYAPDKPTIGKVGATLKRPYKAEKEAANPIFLDLEAPDNTGNVIRINPYRLGFKSLSPPGETL